jgi:hypothetical protein
MSELGDSQLGPPTMGDHDDEARRRTAYEPNRYPEPRCLASTRRGQCVLAAGHNGAHEWELEPQPVSERRTVGDLFDRYRGDDVSDEHPTIDDVRENIEGLLAAYVRLTSPEETVTYVERIAERMRDELGEAEQ